MVENGGMLRDAILKTKRSELGTLVKSRKRKLAELFSATGSYLRIKRIRLDENHDNSEKYDESAFLEANNIEEGRFFDAATLRRVPGADLINYDINNSPPLSRAATPPQNIISTTREENSILYNDNKSPLQSPDDFHDGSSPHRSSRATQAGTPLTHQTSPDEDGMDGIVMEGEQFQKNGIEGDANANDESAGRDNVERSGGNLNVGRDVAMEDGTASAENLKTPKDTTTHSSTSASTLDAQPRSEQAQFSKPAPVVVTTAKTSTIGAQNADPSQKMGQRQSRPGSDHLGAHGEETESIAQRRERRPSQDRRIPGMVRAESNDVTLSQRPPMRIDTSLGNKAKDDVAVTAGSTSVSNTATPLKTAPVTARPTPPERMTTRVSSGALRHKSVCEILGNTPRAATHHTDAAQLDMSSRDEAVESPRFGQLVTSPETSTHVRSRLSEWKEREKERSKLNTVVFARKLDGDGRDGGDKSALSPHGKQEARDYLMSLFAAQASNQHPSFSNLIASARKTLSTENHYLEFHETQDCRILKKIYQLQLNNRWPLRQLVRQNEPERPATVWDAVLDNVKWLRTDFREERKWKLAAAKNLADWCAEWIASSSKRRTLLQVKVLHAKGTAAQHAPEMATDTAVTDRQMLTDRQMPEATPELEPSGDDDFSGTDSLDEELMSLTVPQTVAPAAIFSLTAEDILFSLEMTPIAEKILAELPLYEPITAKAFQKNPSKLSLDKSWRKPLLEVSKFANATITIEDPVPPPKKSRFDYELDEDEDDSTGFRLVADRGVPLPSEQTDCALFNPENRHIINRLHAGHAFRPPSEFPMPHQSFFESRNQSQWTWHEDDELRRLVREYEYNWSLISSCLASKSMHISSAERRTPWECFERWVSFEGLPGEMNRHQYFRAWNARRAAAQHHLQQQYTIQQQQQNTGPTAFKPLRRSSEPIRVEKRKQTKHIALVNAMGRVAKKRESALQKQQHTAHLAAMRKVTTEANQERRRMQAPWEFSAHKYKQECEFREKQAAYRAKMMQMAAAQRAAQSAQPGVSGMPQQPGRPVMGPMSGASPGLASAVPHPGYPNGVPQGRPGSAQAFMNGGPFNNNLNNAQMRPGAVNVPQAQMQPYIQTQQRMAQQQQQQQQQPATADSVRVIMEATRLQEEQRRLAQSQYNAQAGNMNGHMPQANLAAQNAAMMANLQRANGKPSPAGGASPGLAHAQQLSSGMVPVLNQIAQALRQQFPNLSMEQINSMATVQLNKTLRSHNALQMQAGGPANGMQMSPQQQHAMAAYGGQGLNPQLNPQMYAQYMRSQQSQQQRQNPSMGNGMEMSSPRPNSRGDMMPNTNGVMNGGTPRPSQSQSPRPPQAQMTGQ